MKCAVEFCDREAIGRICEQHRGEFASAPEFVRWFRGRPARKRVALADWVRRISAEHRNGGLGAPLSDERAAGGGSDGSGRENATTGQPWALAGVRR